MPNIRPLFRHFFGFFVQNLFSIESKAVSGIQVVTLAQQFISGPDLQGRVPGYNIRPLFHHFFFFCFFVQNLFSI